MRIPPPTSPRPGPPPDHVRGVGPILKWLGIPPATFAAQCDVRERSIYRWIQLGGRRRSSAGRRAEAWAISRGISIEQLWGEPQVPVADMRQRLRLLRTPAPSAASPTPPHPTPPPSEETPMEVTTLEYLTEDALTHFGLSNDPFEPLELDDPERVYTHPGLVRIENAIVRSIRRRSIVAVVGQPGAGKSTLVRRIYGRTSRENRVRLIAPACLDRNAITHNTLAVAILRDLMGRDTSSMAAEARSELLRTSLASQTEAGLYPALVLDEAHLMNSKALLALKHIWDSHTLFRQLAIILIGQPPLQGRLENDPSVRELAGRTQLLELPPLGEHTGDYLRWRFGQVGADADKVFHGRAYSALATRGRYPLWINNLAVRTLNYAARMGDERVSERHVGRI